MNQQTRRKTISRADLLTLIQSCDNILDGDAFQRISVDPETARQFGVRVDQLLDKDGKGFKKVDVDVKTAKKVHAEISELIKTADALGVENAEVMQREGRWFYDARIEKGQLPKKFRDSNVETRSIQTGIRKERDPNKRTPPGKNRNKYIRPGGCSAFFNDTVLTIRNSALCVFDMNGQERPGRPEDVKPRCRGTGIGVTNTVPRLES